MTRVTLKTYVGAGIILAKPDADCGFRFLVLKGRDTGIWSFSKGHPELEDRESPLRTAARETYEETGLAVGDYRIFGNSVRFGKRPYWLGIVSTDRVILRPREHSAYAWLSWEEITQVRGNSDVRSWVQKYRNTDGEFRRLLTISSHY